MDKLDIQFTYWEHECGDCCCYEDGTAMSINGKVVLDDVTFAHDDVVRALLESLGITNFTISSEI